MVAPRSQETTATSTQIPGVRLYYGYSTPAGDPYNWTNEQIADVVQHTSKASENSDSVIVWSYFTDYLKAVKKNPDLRHVSFEEFGANTGDLRNNPEYNAFLKKEQNLVSDIKNIETQAKSEAASGNYESARILLDSIKNKNPDYDYAETKTYINKKDLKSQGIDAETYDINDNGDVVNKTTGEKYDATKVAEEKRLAEETKNTDINKANTVVRGADGKPTAYYNAEGKMVNITDSKDLPSNLKQEGDTGYKAPIPETGNPNEIVYRGSGTDAAIAGYYDSTGKFIKVQSANEVPSELFLGKTGQEALAEYKKTAESQAGEFVAPETPGAYKAPEYAQFGVDDPTTPDIDESKKYDVADYVAPKLTAEMVQNWDKTLQEWEAPADAKEEERLLNRINLQDPYGAGSGDRTQQLSTLITARADARKERALNLAGNELNIQTEEAMAKYNKELSSKNRSYETDYQTYLKGLNAQDTEAMAKYEADYKVWEENYGTAWATYQYKQQEIKEAKQKLLDIADFETKAKSFATETERSDAWAELQRKWQERDNALQTEKDLKMQGIGIAAQKSESALNRIYQTGLIDREARTKELEDIKTSNKEKEIAKLYADANKKSAWDYIAPIATAAVGGYAGSLATAAKTLTTPKV